MYHWLSNCVYIIRLLIFMEDTAVLGSHEEQWVFIPPPDNLKGI